MAPNRKLGARPLPPDSARWTLSRLGRRVGVGAPQPTQGVLHSFGDLTRRARGRTGREGGTGESAHWGDAEIIARNQPGEGPCLRQPSSGHSWWPPGEAQLAVSAQSFQSSVAPQLLTDASNAPPRSVGSGSSYRTGVKPSSLPA